MRADAGLHLPAPDWKPPLITALFALMFFTLAASGTDFDKREAREAIAVRNMARGANLFVPKINEDRLRTKPPLYYWSGLAAGKIFGGIGETSLRSISVLSAALTVFTIALLGSRMFSTLTGVFAGLILATGQRFVYLAAHARIDMEFACFITLALTMFWQSGQADSPAGKNRLALFGSLALGLAILTKGPLAWIYVLLVLFTYGRLTRKPVPWLSALAVPLAVTLLWLLPALKFGGEEFRSMILNETLGRATGQTSEQLHKEPFYFYFGQILLVSLPWSLFLPLALWHGWRIERGNPRWQYPATCVALLFVLLSLFPGKRGDYLLPLLPMLSLLIADYFSQTLSGRAEHPRAMFCSILPLAVLAGGGGLLALALIFSRWIPMSQIPGLSGRDRLTAQLLLDHHLPQWPLLALSALMLLVAAWGLPALQKKGYKLSLFYGIFGFSLMIVAFIHGPVASVVDRYNSLKPFAAMVRQLAEGEARTSLGIVGEYREDLIYYLDLPVERVSVENAPGILAESPERLLLARESEAKSLLEHQPGSRVLASTRDLFRNYLLIGR